MKQSRLQYTNLKLINFDWKFINSKDTLRKEKKESINLSSPPENDNYDFNLIENNQSQHNHYLSYQNSPHKSTQRDKFYSIHNISNIQYDEDSLFNQLNKKIIKVDDHNKHFQIKTFSNLNKASLKHQQPFSDKYPKKSDFQVINLYNQEIDSKKQKNLLFYPPLEKNTYKLPISNSKVIKEQWLNKWDGKKVKDKTDIQSLYYDDLNAQQRIALQRKQNTSKKSRLVGIVSSALKCKKLNLSDTQQYKPADIRDFANSSKGNSFISNTKKYYDGWFLSAEDRSRKFKIWQNKQKKKKDSKQEKEYLNLLQTLSD